MRGFGWVVFALTCVLFAKAGLRGQPYPHANVKHKSDDAPKGKGKRGPAATVDAPAPLLTWSVAGAPKLDRTAAWDDALDEAARVVGDRLNLSAALPREFVQAKLVAASRTELVHVAEANADLPRIHLDLALTPETRREVIAIERKLRVENRLGWAARGLGVAVAGLLAVAGYIRFDEWTKGYASGVLRAAFAALAVAGAALAWLKW